MIKKSTRRLIIYELNEVPPKLLNYYINNFPLSNLSNLVANSQYFITHTNDSGELHPWSTWPTVHRGVTNDLHNIRFINQDLRKSSNYPPIWEVLLKNKNKIGIFGSLQSYPPINDKNVCFYVPDTFSPDAKTIPKSLEKYQDLNLKLVADNKAIQKSFTIHSMVSFLSLVINRTISLRALLQTTKHVTKEFINAKYKARRSTIQPIIGFDIFLKKLKKEQPEFSTFFTNHVAGMMHRYWKNLFPEDFSLEKNKKDFHSDSIIKAMHIADKQIGELLKYAKKKGSNLWVLSSMGQEAIDRGEYLEELFLDSFEKLILCLGLDNNNYELQLAMQPDICIACKSKQSMEKLIDAAAKLKDTDEKLILKKRYNPVGLKLNLSIQRSIAANKNKKLSFNNCEPISLNDFGFKLIKRDIGTGYHIPDGIFIAYGSYSENISKYLGSEGKIDTTKIFKMILKVFNINEYKY